MSKKPPGNIRRVCAECAPKPVAAFSRRPLKWFWGKLVKLGFPVKGEYGPTVEHMWVEVVRSVLPDELGKRTPKVELIGKLDNDPIYADMQRGEYVAFHRKEVEDVWEEEEDPAPQTLQRRKVDWND